MASSHGLNTKRAVVALNPRPSKLSHACPLFESALLLQWHLRRGEWREAEQYLRAAVARLTARNPNPADGEAYYYLGLALKWQVSKGGQVCSCC